jgi:hypothetical protein
MRIYALIYLVGAFLFFFMPEETFYLINVGPRVFKLAEEIPAPSERFWVVLSTSMMIMLFFAAVYSSMFPYVKGFVAIHLLSKATSVAGFLYCFFQKRYFAYGIGAACDGSIFLIVLLFYLRSAASGHAPPTTPPAHEPSHDPNPATEPSGSGGPHM